MASRICPQCKHAVGAHILVCPLDGTPLGDVPFATPGLIGKLLAGRYRVQRKLGEGGMGEVFLAQHEAIEKRVALKVLRAEYSTKAEVVARFQLEAKSASRIKHPNVVDVFDFGSTEDGRFFLALEYLEGNDLADELHKLRTLDPQRAVNIMLQVCAALGSAHEVGVVHRDMKPENVFLQHGRHGYDEVKIVDFGIAKMREISSDDGAKSGENERRLTKAGAVFGTPEYMSPEQATGKDVDHSVDIYAVGVMLFELLTGKVPFSGNSVLHTLTMHVNEAPPSLSQCNPHSTASPEFEAVVMTALAKSPSARFQNMDAFAEALRTTPEGGSLLPPAPRRSGYRPPPSSRRSANASTGPTPLSISLNSPSSRETAIEEELMAELGDVSLLPEFATSSSDVRPSEVPMPLVTRARPSAEQMSFDEPAPPSPHRAIPQLTPITERRPEKSRTPVLVTLGVIAILGAGAGVMLLSNQRASPLVASEATLGAPLVPSNTVLPAAASIEPPSTATAEPEPPPSASAAPVAPPVAPTTVALQVRSEPTGAVVRKAGFQVCDTTPCELTAELNEPVELTAEKGDWRGTAKVLALRAQTVTIKLAKPGPLPGVTKFAQPPAAGRAVTPVPMCEVMEGDLKILRPCK